MSKDRNSSILDLVRPLEFHCIHLRFLIIHRVILVPERFFEDMVSAAEVVVLLGHRVLTCVVGARGAFRGV
jgi:hypothetical protein